jgi:hypothetical protein
MLKSVSLLDEINKGGFEASLVTTFNCYFPFYEEVVLRRLTSKGIRHNVLLMDAGQCSQAVSQHPPLLAGRYYSLLPMRVSGAFHPKVVLLAGKKKGSLFIGSHNLTLSGYGYNRELTNFFQYFDDKDEASLECFRSAWQQINGWLKSQKQLPLHVSKMVQKVGSFAPWLTPSPQRGTQYAVLSSQPNSPSLLEQLLERIDGQVEKIIISGAFFDNELEFIKVICSNFAQAEITIGVDPATVQMPKKRPHFSKARFVDSSSIGTDGDKKVGGYLHAKFVLFKQINGKVILISGSANPSAPAWLEKGISKNIEMVVCRSDDAVEESANDLGLLDIFTMPELTTKDWETITNNDRLNIKSQEGTTPRVDLATSANGVISFCSTNQNGPETVQCRLLGADKEQLASVSATKNSKLYETSIIDSTVEATWLTYPQEGKDILYLIHHEEIITEQSRTGTQRRLKDALASLSSNTPNLETLIQCVDKIIFAKSNEIDKGLRKTGLAKMREDKDSDKNEADGSPLSIDLSETAKSKKKYRLRYSDDLSYLFDTLLYHLRIDHLTSPPVIEGIARSEEELIGTDDEEKKEEEDDGKRILALCHNKINTLISRMIKQFDSLRKSEVELEDVVVRLTGVLALLRHLQEFDGGKVFWIPEGKTAFPLPLRKKLMEAASNTFLDGTFSLIFSNTKNESIYGSDEIAKLKGLILWLAWDCNINLSLESKYAEAPEETEERFQLNGLIILLAQLSGGDYIIIEEARKSITLTRPSIELNWLDWIESTGNSLRNFQYHNHGACVSGESAEPNYLAFHPKIADLGVRLVKRANSTFVDLISFLPEKEHRSFRSNTLLVSPLKNVLRYVPS